jgi:CDP-glucose 4,6-dehydratase
VVEQIAKIWGAPLSILTKQDGNPREANYLKLDCFKAKLKLGWYPLWNLNYALKKTVEWYRDYYNHETMIDATLRQIHEYEEGIHKEISQRYELQIL